MAKAKEEAKSGLIDNVVVEKSPVVKDVPVLKEEKVAESPEYPGHATRCFRG
jgi:hypothetical protein